VMGVVESRAAEGPSAQSPASRSRPAPARKKA
jgi:hypothetical protein